jgi:hypothetical protein
VRGRDRGGGDCSQVGEGEEGVDECEGSAEHRSIGVVWWWFDLLPIFRIKGRYRFGKEWKGDWRLLSRW